MVESTTETTSSQATGTTESQQQPTTIELIDDKIVLNEDFKKNVAIPYFKDIYKDLAAQSDAKSKGINKVSILNVSNTHSSKHLQKRETRWLLALHTWCVLSSDRGVEKLSQEESADSDRRAKSVWALQFFIDAGDFCSENRQAPFIKEVALNSNELLPTAY